MPLPFSRGEAMSDLLWRVWWTGARGVIKSVAGEFSRHRDAMACIEQLQAKHPNASFTIEYIGRNIAHQHNGQINSKY
jgi:hypothetical protein